MLGAETRGVDTAALEVFPRAVERLEDRQRPLVTRGGSIT
jgi:hypothetical protein